MLPSPIQLLRGAGTLMLIVGLGVTIWLVDSTIIHPWSKITGDLPFWIPFLATIIIGAGSLTLLFFKAARRFERIRSGGQASNSTGRT